MEAARVPERTPRERLLFAMATSIRERGYRETTVADVVRLARTSRRTFYEQFDDRADCLVALLELLGERLMAVVADAVVATEPWEGQIEAAISAFLRAWVADPVLSANILNDLGAESERALTLRDAQAESFAKLLVALVDQARAKQNDDVPPLSLPQALFFVAGMRELVIRAPGNTRALNRLAPTLAALFRAVLFAQSGSAAKK